MTERPEDGYDNVSDIPELKALIGCTLDDISGSEKGEKPDEVYLLFSNGTKLTITLNGDQPIFSFEPMVDDNA